MFLISTLLMMPLQVSMGGRVPSILIFYLIFNIIKYLIEIPVFYQRLLFFILFGFIIIFYFVNFISTLYCEGAEDPFPLVQQFTDLSSLNTKNMVKEAYSGVS